MKVICQKTISSSILFAMLAFVGGFCFSNVALADSHSDVHAMPKTEEVHCAGQVMQLKQGLPINGVMPCCIDRHDNIPTVVPKIENQKIKLFSAVANLSARENYTSTQQKTFSSNSSPPPEPDILSSIFKKE